jgi:hypothetical protein
VSADFTACPRPSCCLLADPARGKVIYLSGRDNETNTGIDYSCGYVSCRLGRCRRPRTPRGAQNDTNLFDVLLSQSRGASQDAMPSSHLLSVKRIIVPSLMRYAYSSPYN